MHQKKSEIQIGTESRGISSDFNPAPHHRTQTGPILSSPSSLFSPSTTPTTSSTTIKIASATVAPPQILIVNDDIAPPATLTTTTTTPYKRPLLTHHHHHHRHKQSNSSLSKSPTIYRFSSPPAPKETHFPSISLATKSVLLRLHRRLCHHLRLLLLLSLPFFYFLVSHPSRSFLLDFLSAFAFSAALLFSLNLAAPRLPSIRLLLSRGHLPFSIKLARPTSFSSSSRPHLPVFWSIGSRPPRHHDKRVNSGCFVQAYSNGDVYEGEFHKGQCSGSGVYYYYMSGRYEGDWVDGKYDGYGVETWARGSRYRGQYRQGLRHGFGVYRFYTGDVYTGEWASGQSHGCGVHTCEDGSRYVGEFKWGVKHGLGHYHFR